MSWLNPALLGFTTLAAVPIIIHLWLRQRTLKVSFGALRFLRRSGQEALTRKRWLEWLLTAVRVAMVVLLALAFARPFFGGPPPEAGTGKTRDLVLLIDTSRSMSFNGHLKEARSLAEGLISEALPGTTITVTTFAGAGSATAHTAKDRDEALALVRRLDIQGGTTDIPAAIAKVASALAGAGGEVHLISDLQITGMPRNHDLPRLPKDYRLVAHRIGDGAAPPTGIAVEGSAVSAEITPGTRNLAVSARVVNRGPERTANAHLLVAGKELDHKAMRLPQNGEAVASLTGTVREPGDFPAEIVLDVPGNLPGDSSYHFLVRVVNKIRIAIVNGHSVDDPSEDAAFFLPPAFNAGEDSPFAAEVSRTLPDLKGFDLVVLAAVKELPAADVTRLRAFVSKGGGVLIGLGPDVDPTRFNASLGNLAPARLSAWEADQKLFLVVADAAHPLPAQLVADGKGDLGTARFTGVASLKDAQAAEVILRFDDGRPALLESHLDQGAVVMLASGLDRRTGDLPLRPIFVPLMRELARQLTTRADDAHQLAAGDALSLPAGATLVRPGGTSEKADTAHAVALLDPGVYRVDAGGTTAWYAVNADRNESDLVAMEGADLEKAVSAASTAKLRATESGVERVVADGERLAAERRLNIGWWLLLALLPLALAELWLSRLASRT